MTRFNRQGRLNNHWFDDCLHGCAAHLNPLPVFITSGSSGWISLIGLP
jgi:hypothetical protein